MNSNILFHIFKQYIFNGKVIYIKWASNIYYFLKADNLTKRHHPIYIYNNHYDKKRRELAQRIRNLEKLYRRAQTTAKQEEGGKPRLA